jgi:DNA recombination protein Rad52
MGISCTMRVTLKDGSYKEDVGYGFIQNAPSQGTAFEKCRKEASTDALKRCLRLFGNSTGNCLYDKQYGKWISKLKVEKEAFNSNNLRRPGMEIVL